MTQDIPPPRGARVRVLPLVLTLAASLLLLVASLGFVLYLRDYALEATVQETHCASGPGEPSSVDVKTRRLGIDHTVHGVPAETCLALRPGQFVRYHIRTEHTIVYASEGGDCLYDSETGAC